MNKKIIPVAVISMFLVGCTFAVAYAENINLTTTDTTSSITPTATITTKCTDSDGTNYFTKGLVKDTAHPGSFQNYDRCISKTKLLEYTCKNDAWYATYYECPKGCAEGVCLEKDVVATTTPDNTTTTTTKTDLPDGTLVKMPDDPKVYVIKDGEKVWIQTAEQFKALGYKWQDIKVVSSEKMKDYKDKTPAKATIVKSKQDRKVYRLENGRLIWVPSVAAFNAQGLKWDEVTEIDTDVTAKYQETKLIQDETGDIYYITNSGKKILIISGAALKAYEKQDATTVAAVSDEVADSIEDVTLVKEAEDAKVYKLENGKKKWIKTATAFQREGYKWEDIETVDAAALQAYTETQAIE